MGSAGAFNALMDVAVDPFGNILVADTANHRVRRVTPSGGAGMMGKLECVKYVHASLSSRACVFCDICTSDNHFGGQRYSQMD